MDLTFTFEQDELREQARAFLAGRPEPAWEELAELGWTGVSIAEDAGGAGLSFVEEAVLFEELGRALYHGPYFSTVALALPALPADLRAEVAAGETSWTLALAPLVSDLDTAAPTDPSETVLVDITDLKQTQREITEFANPGPQTGKAAV